MSRHDPNARKRRRRRQLRRARRKRLIPADATCLSTRTRLPWLVTKSITRKHHLEF